jgi:hypothetical protein
LHGEASPLRGVHFLQLNDLQIIQRYGGTYTRPLKEKLNPKRSQSPELLSPERQSNTTKI